MVTDEEIKRVIYNEEKNRNERISYQVTPSEMKKFNGSAQLPLMISSRKISNDKELLVGATEGYNRIEEMCLISVTSLKKTISGRDRVTRTFLYRFAVGLHMELEEANRYFELCGGKLHEDSSEDYICIKALEDHDDIHLFCDQFEKYIGKKLTMLK